MEYDTAGMPRIQIPELIESKDDHWVNIGYKWVAVNTGTNAGTITLEWQGAAALQAAAAALFATYILA